MAIASLSPLLGPPVSGVLIERFGGFTQVSIFGGVFALAGAALAVVAKMLTPEGVFGRV